MSLQQTSFSHSTNWMQINKSKEQSEAGNLSVQLGQSKQPRPVKPIEGTLLNQNHIYVTFLSGLRIRKCQGCPTPIEQLSATWI